MMMLETPYQPYAEYDVHVTRKLDVTAGTKFAHYNIQTKQYADNGKTIGGLGTNNPNSFVTNSGSYSSWLPSIDGNYKLTSNWSAYAQLATGSVVPPSKVFDYQQSATGTPVKTLPKQQRSTTYQFGSRHVTFNADFYHTRFQNSYSSTLDPSGKPIYFLQPSSITKGFEAESNIYIVHGLSVFERNGWSRNLRRQSRSKLHVGNDWLLLIHTAVDPQLTLSAPSGLWAANIPSDTQTKAVTYQYKGWDAGIFNKRVGTLYQDNGQYHNQATINPFSVTNLFFNYTVRSGGRFDQTKIRLSFNNLFDQHSITGNSIAGTALAQNIVANGTTTYVDPFNTTGQTPINGGDNISVLPGRSVMLSVTFGLSPNANRIPCFRAAVSHRHRRSFLCVQRLLRHARLC